MAIAFAVSVAILLHLLPTPHSPPDYLIAGTVASLAAMLVLFAGLFGLRRDNFVKLQRRDAERKS